MRLARAAIVADCLTLRDDIRHLQSDIAGVGTDVSALSRLRRTTYVSGIVQAYGLLEQSIDRLLIAIAVLYNAIYLSSDNMPERVRQEFRRLALQSLLDGDRARLREPIDEGAVLSAINAGSDSSLRILVPAVFTRAQANYRHPQVREMLSRLDVLIGVPSGVGIQHSLDALGMATTESAILDVVERRNELAHAYAVPDNILSADQILAVVDIIEAYLLAIEESANSRLLTKSEKFGSATVVGTVAHRWSKAIGIDVEGGAFRLGDSLVFRRKSGRYLSRTISSLKVSGVDVDHVEATPGSIVLKVGVGFSDTAPRQLEGSVAMLLPERLTDLLPSRDT